jgi:phosphonate transport system substrate-binding protein
MRFMPSAFFMKIRPLDRGRFLMVLAVVLLSACSPEGETRIVDFTQTIPVARPGEGSTGRPSLKVAVGAMVSPKETFVHYRELLDYLATRLAVDVELVQRKTYGEVNELIGEGKIDLAFICSGPYATGREKYGFEMLAVPEVQGSHFYHSYLIVGKGASFERIADLRGRVFAFTDPDSHTGKLVPTSWLAEIGERPETFFGKVVYTYSHDNSILAVSRGLVDGAAVDGLIWEFYQQKSPALTSETRVIRKSDLYGIPPVVASRTLAPATKEPLKGLLLSMHENADGKRILEELMIDRFVAPREEWYDSIRQLERTVGNSQP